MLNANGCIQLEVGTRTDVGRVRSNNEDSCLVLPALNLFVISDGMGGESHGEVASAIVSDTIARYCSEECVEEWSNYGDFRRPDLSERTHRLARAIHFANKKVFEAAQTDPTLYGMGATAIAVWLDGPRMSLVHAGDSRAYLFRSGILRRLTVDHTLVTEQIRRGLIKPEEAHLSKVQNILLRALGVQEHVDLDEAEWTLADGDAILLCTDGLTHMVSDVEIAETLARNSDSQTCADDLVALANAHGGEDNISVIVVRVVAIS